MYKPSVFDTTIYKAAIYLDVPQQRGSFRVRASEEVADGFGTLRQIQLRANAVQLEKATEQMSLITSNLSVLAYANNFTLWHYVTTDKSILTPKYFNAASDMLRVNDLLLVNLDTTAKPNVRFYNVIRNKAGVVAVSDMQAGDAEPETSSEPDFEWSNVKPGMAFTNDSLWNGEVVYYTGRHPFSYYLMFTDKSGLDYQAWSLSGPEKLKHLPEHDIEARP